MKNFRTRLKDQRGFSLIELMIVIAIIALLIAVGIPAWQSVTQSGNETAATQNIDLIRKLQIQYASRNRGNFAPTFDELIKSVQLDDKFKGETPLVNGYIYTMKVQEASGSQPSFYSVNANPQVSEGVTATGTRYFYYDSTLPTMRFTKENRPAKPDDPGI